MRTSTDSPSFTCTDNGTELRNWYVVLVRGSGHSAMMILAVPMPAANIESVTLAMIRVPCCFSQRVLLMVRANKPMTTPMIAITTMMKMTAAHICYSFHQCIDSTGM